MKLFRLRVILLFCLIYAIVGTATTTSTHTNTQTESLTNLKTNTQTEAKMSIFSYDFLSVMKKKLKLAKEKGLVANQNKLETENTEEWNPLSRPAKQRTQYLSNAQTQSTTNTQTPPNVSNTNQSPRRRVRTGDGPVFYQGWLKYFKYEDNMGNNKRPSSFFKNNEFFEQKKMFPNVDFKTIGNDGIYEYVPDLTYWFFTLYKDSLLISTSKKQSTSKNSDVLNLDLIQPIVEGPGYRGGIIDFGDFAEGHCLKLATLTSLTWIICAENRKEKEIFMSALKNGKLLSQRNQGIIKIEVEKPNSAPRRETLDSYLSPQTEQPKALQLGVAMDGYWMVLQNWSQCSKKCDSGTSTLQRLCIPPKNGGKICEGEPLITKTCNTNPCPKVKTIEKQKASNNTVTLKPILKVMPYSNRPQKYHKCIIKEADGMMSKFPDNYVNNLNPYDPEKKKELPPHQVPVRIILNNRTISFYENADDLNSHHISYNLKTATLGRSTRDRNCYTILENKKLTEICPMGISTDFAFFKEWAQEFHLFKYNCETKTETVDLKFKDELRKKMEKARMELLVEKQTQMRKQNIQTSQQELHTKILKKTNMMARQAIMKEENLETLIEQEETERQKDSEKEIMEQIEKEKIKNECIIKAIKEKQLENEFKLENQEIDEQVVEIKKKAMAEVQVKRNNLKKKIQEMRKKSLRKEAKLKQQLLQMKMTMATQMNKMYKNGDINRCKDAISSDKNRNNYCVANFDDIFLFSQCKDNDDFCQMCCENEFGEMHAENRNKCLRELCKSQKGNKIADNKDMPKNLKSKEPNPGQVEAKGTVGKWIWIGDWKEKN